MQRYIAIRVFQSIITLFAISLIVFALGRITGNPLDVLLPLEAQQDDYDRISKVWGLDKPLYQQYFTFLGNAASGNFGDSWKWPGRTAMELVLQRLPNTAILAGVALGVSTAIALPIGVLSAVKRDTWFDHIGKIIALFGQSLPPFWLGIILIWLFAIKIDLFPTSGNEGFRSIVLPGIAIGWFQVAALMRLIRSAMLDVLDSEYVKLARIKGVPEWKVIWKHSLRNAAIVPLTYFALILGALMVGSVSIETVFNWPGVGQLAVEAAKASDFQVLHAIVIVFCGIYVLANLVVDILYGYLDPRIRYQ